MKDGTPIRFRLLRREDKDDLQKGFDQLSRESIRCRFLAPLNKLSEQQWNYLTEIDNKDHLAVCAHEAGDELKGMGIARYVRLPEEPDAAEMAITILDEYQGRGLGAELQKQLMHYARMHGIRKLISYVLDENTSMLKILSRFGARSQRASGNLIKVELDIT